MYAEQYREALQVLEEAYERLPHEERIAQTLAWHLAASPDKSLRNGQRALDLALNAYESGQNFDRAVTVAMAYAELDLCKKAAEWQQRAIERASESLASQVIIEQMKRNLTHFQTQVPCRVPGTIASVDEKP